MLPTVHYCPFVTDAVAQLCAKQPPYHTHAHELLLLLLMLLLLLKFPAGFFIDLLLFTNLAYSSTAAAHHAPSPRQRCYSHRPRPNSLA
jgi:hypothetical protein